MSFLKIGNTRRLITRYDAVGEETLRICVHGSDHATHIRFPSRDHRDFVLNAFDSNIPSWEPTAYLDVIAAPDFGHK